MDKSIEDRKSSLIDEILTSWGEEIVAEEGDEKTKQALRAATPALRVFMTINVFEERARYFSGCNRLAEMNYALDACKSKLYKQYELGKLLVDNGFCFQTSEKSFEYSSEQLKESLEKAISEAGSEYGDKSQETLNGNISSAIEAIEIFGDMYN
ncbi:hypothetical protein [Thiohalomonas denitrificans]|uniref:Uncharacterized protein n=1 Tax=Thiohalomonas denitrificans TaxID=415747 RepID=A0A1G5R0K8_9GAMM|nr:hypothetical protein [Thiohalomonas denitrificans]SCZ67562.1 hypothetical protein SAMN03097708_03163 [Thiohalomonas denitrificans]